MDCIFIPPIEPVFATIPPSKNTFFEYKPNCPFGFVPCNLSELNPLKSPNLAFKSTAYNPEPVLSTISINGVLSTVGLALILIYPVFVFPVDTITCPSVYVCAADGLSPKEPESASVPTP